MYGLGSGVFLVWPLSVENKSLVVENDDRPGEKCGDRADCNIYHRNAACGVGRPGLHAMVGKIPYAFNTRLGSGPLIGFFLHANDPQLQHEHSAL